MTIALYSILIALLIMSWLRRREKVDLYLLVPACVLLATALSLKLLEEVFVIDLVTHELGLYFVLLLRLGSIIGLLYVVYKILSEK